MKAVQDDHEKSWTSVELQEMTNTDVELKCHIPEQMT